MFYRYKSICIQKSRIFEKNMKKSRKSRYNVVWVLDRYKSKCIQKSLIFQKKSKKSRKSRYNVDWMIDRYVTVKDENWWMSSFSGEWRLLPKWLDYVGKWCKKPDFKFKCTSFTGHWCHLPKLVVNDDKSQLIHLFFLL